MGAATSLMHAYRDPNISAIIVDSPFTDLLSLVKDLVYKHSKIPGLITETVMKVVIPMIKKRAEFDIHDVDPIKNI